MQIFVSAINKKKSFLLTPNNKSRTLSLTLSELHSFRSQSDPSREIFVLSLATFTNLADDHDM